MLIPFIAICFRSTLHYSSLYCKYVALVIICLSGVSFSLDDHVVFFSLHQQNIQFDLDLISFHFLIGDSSKYLQLNCA
jgi:hypothetical protein